MQRTLSAVLAGHTGEHVTIEGWIHRRRRLAAVTFLILRDRSGLAQVVITDNATREQIDGLGEETVVRVEGLVTANTQAPAGIEVTAPTITPLSSSAAVSPLELWRPTMNAALPTLLDNAAVAWRHPAQRAIWQIAAASLQGFRGVLDQQDFTEIQTPKLVASSTESGANVFTVDYFGRPAYLAQSPQFYKQMMVGVFERVYEVGPVFRTTPHATSQSTSRSTPRLASSATTATYCASCAMRSRAWSTASAPPHPTRWRWPARACRTCRRRFR